MSLAMTIIASVLILLFSYCQRLLFSAFEANDQRWILWLLRRQAKENWVQYEVTDHLSAADLGYPVLFHWLLSRLPENAWVVTGFLLNAAFDIIIATLLASLIFISFSNSPNGTFLPVVSALVAFLFCPALLPPTARMMAFNGRAFGLVIFNLYVLALGWFFLTGNYWAAPLAVLLFVVLTLSSQFGFQAAVAVTIISVIWYQAWVFFALLLLLFGILAMQPRLGLQQPLHYFIGLYKWAYLNRNINSTPAVRSRWLSMALVHLKHRQWRALWMVLFIHSPLVIVLLYGIWVWIVAWLAWARPELSSVFSNGAVLYAALVCCAMILTCLLTAFKPFSIFGQAERYLENGAAPTAFIFAAMIAHLPNDVALMALLIGIILSLLAISINALTVLIQHRRLLAGSDFEFGSDEPSYIAWFDNLNVPLRILTVPMARGQTVIEAFRNTRHENVKTLYDWLSPHDEKPLEYMARYLVGQSFTAESIAAAVSEQDVNVVLIVKREAHIWDGTRHTSGDTAVMEKIAEKAVLLGENDEFSAYFIERE